MYVVNRDLKNLEPGFRRFLDAELEPAFLEYDDGPIPRAQMQRWMKQLTDFGLIKAPFDSKWGGYQMDWLSHLHVFEELVYTSLDIAVPCMMNAVTAAVIDANGTDAQKERYLPKLLSGDIFGCVAISEPDVGSDVAAVGVRALQDGEDWVISGEKTWISSGEYADIAVVACKTGPQEITHIIVDCHVDGVETAGIKKMALNGQSTAQLFFDSARTPLGNTLGMRGHGLRNTLRAFEIARCHMAVWGIGISRRAMDEAISYSTQRRQHGKLIAGHQLIADKLATMATNIDAARLLTHRAATMLQSGERADKECAMAKWFGTEMALQCTRDALQIHGGNGVCKGLVLERLAREAIINPIPDGTTEIQKLLIARSLTGVSAFK
ncbi:MAG: acyl-CoA dehydrogenase family protein [Pseudomonadota bacterium]